MPEEDHFITSSDGKRGYTFYRGNTSDGSFVALIKLMDGRIFYGRVDDFQNLDSWIRAREEKAAFDYLYNLPDRRVAASEADWRALLSGELALTPQKDAKQTKPRSVNSIKKVRARLIQGYYKNGKQEIKKEGEFLVGDCPIFEIEGEICEHGIRSENKVFPWANIMYYEFNGG